MDIALLLLLVLLPDWVGCCWCCCWMPLADAAAAAE
jgi:hypothetical protein